MKISVLSSPKSSRISIQENYISGNNSGKRINLREKICKNPS